MIANDGPLLKYY